MPNSHDILIVEDDCITRRGLEAFLQNVPSVGNIRSTTRHGFSQLPLDSYNNCQDIVVIKSYPIVIHDLKYFREADKHFSHFRALLLGENTDIQYILGAFQAGILAYLTTDAPHWEIERALKQVAEWKHYLCSQMSTELAGLLFGKSLFAETDNSPIKLNLRERELLYYLSKGFANKEIAGKLHLSEATVRNYLSRLYTKLQISHRSEAIAFACNHISAITLTEKRDFE
jgi:DNA-binding NarL/FixJ family response regulator